MPGPSDIQSAFGGRVFGVAGHREEGQGWGGSAGDLHSLSLRFIVQGEEVGVKTATSDPGEVFPLVRLALDVFRSLPPLPLTLTFEERAARLRVCGHEHDFKSYVCGDCSIAFAPVGDLWVTVALPTALLDSQAFELDDEAEVRWGDEL